MSETTAPVTAEDLAARIVRWTTDGEPNVQVGDQILNQGEMCTVEDVYVEGLGNGSSWMHVMLRDPRAANTGLPVHAAEFSGAGFVAVRSAALAGNPGDLPARMAAEMQQHGLDEQTGDCICGKAVTDWDAHLAAAAMSVRWEDNARTVAESERLRAELAEARAKLGRLDEARRLDVKWRQAAEAERDRLKAAILDIDAHATPYGDIPDDPGYVGTYLVTAGALHRALGKIGHTAPKCQAEAELARIVTEIEAEWEKIREAEGATARDESVVVGIYNGLGIALRIVRGES